MNKKKTIKMSADGQFPPLSQRFLTWFSRPWLLLGLLLTIPAFYLLLVGESDFSRNVGHAMYGVAALIILIDTSVQWRVHADGKRRSGKLLLDGVIIGACVASAFPSTVPWNTAEWLLRLALCAAIVLRIAMLVLHHMRPGHLMQMISLALLMLSSAGAGFYWLEPQVHSYADGVWLAFTTVATVGYGDIVPSTPASKIFAVFIVLLGYALFSLVTASIAALFVEEEEAGLERELHADIRALAREVAALRQELRQRDAAAASELTVPHQ